MADKFYFAVPFCGLRTRYAAPIPSRTTIRVERIQRCLIRSAFDWSSGGACEGGGVAMAGAEEFVCDRAVPGVMARARSTKARRSDFTIRFVQFMCVTRVTLNNSRVKLNRAKPSKTLKHRGSKEYFCRRAGLAPNCPAGRAGRQEPVTACQSDVSGPDLRDVLGRSKLPG